MANEKIAIVLGGGAAGYFGAIACAHAHPERQVVLLEKTQAPLAKVRISGGGRCNVTHACFDPKLLIQHYPRGSKELLGPFMRFQPRDTIRWFQERGVEIKAEDDGRMFPVTDDSQTIIDCLQKEARKRGVDVRLLQRVEKAEKSGEHFVLTLAGGETMECSRLLLATGSSPQGFALAQTFGHTIEPPVPSLFTFNIPTSPLQDLAGITVEKVRLKIAGTTQEQLGPLLITHWGFSGPAALKLSAWAARLLHEANYHVKLVVDWLPDLTLEEKEQLLLGMKKAKSFHNPLPKNLWKRLVDTDKRLADIPNRQLLQWAQKLHADVYQVEGKTTYKQEFVTCGGVKLKEVNFKTMESRLCPGLHFAGEILDIDGVTGGFNFQSAWTTGWLAGQAMI